ncbi:MAG TPA: ABC transporter substrate-binding protein [Streptomyces sp.]|nr:ABC transporter substrate-binding protein [Streptomyces sp.]
MFDRNRPLALTSFVVISALLGGCSTISGDDGETGDPIVVGTTSAPSVLDPAGAWDGSWELFRNIYQTLMYFPNSSSSPKPDAAKSCSFTDSASKVYSCTLRKGLTFSNGHPLTSKSVKFSINRIFTIDAKAGPAGLLGSLDHIETPDERTVVFHLNKSDATYPMVLATPATAIVDPKVYPGDSLLKGDGIAGSGPYALADYEDGKKAVLEKNTRYKGPAEMKNDGVTIRYFQKSDAMVKALKHKDIDVIFRGLTPGEVNDFQKAGAKGSDAVQLTEMVGTEIRYLVFNPKYKWAGNEAVRKAIAQLIDRKALVRNVYDRTAEALYSMVPATIIGHTNAFYDEYGEPSRAKAESILRDAGIDKKVPLTLWYTTDRYGTTMKAEFEELQRQLNGSGLFDVTIKGRPWKEFSAAYSKGEYPVFGRGWFPDFPDPDNYISPFVGETNALGAPYVNPKLTDELLPASRREANRAKTADEFAEAQDVIAQDARLLPLWQGKVYVASRKDIAGIEGSLDPSTIMLMWKFHRMTSW